MQSSQKLEPDMVVCLTPRVEGFYDGYAADRSLALLVSGYTDFAAVAADEERRLRSTMQSSQYLNPGIEGVPDAPN